MRLPRIFSLSDKAANADVAHKLYVTLVEQARQPVFYTDYGAPDTQEGRFDMIALHIFLLMRRFKQDNEKTAELSQALFDVMFADMDRNFREMGVGDLMVGKRVKNLVKAFYGRINAYETAIDEKNDVVLAEALKRNLFRDVEAQSYDVAGMIKYIHHEIASLDKQQLAKLMSGEISLGVV